MEKYVRIFFSSLVGEMGLLLQHHTISKCKIIFLMLLKLIEVMTEM